MDKLFPWFPLSLCVRSGHIKSLVISLVLYLAACMLMGILQTILGWIPIAGVLIKIACGLLGIYCVVGMVLSVLQFLKP